MATLNTVFKQVFREELGNSGFVKIKGRQPYFVRVIVGEIVQVITMRSHWCGEEGYKKFEILGGIATVYRESIDMTKCPSNNINWLHCLFEFYQRADLVGFDYDYRRKLMTFEYKKDDEASLILAMKSALYETQKIILPVFDKVKNLDDCIDFFDVFNSLCLVSGNYNEKKGWYDEQEYTEFLLYIQTNNHDDLIDKFAVKYQEAVQRTKVGRVWGEWSSLQNARDKLENYRKCMLHDRDFVYNNPKLYEKVLKELKLRKIRNTEVLKSYGLKV